jgi:type II secretory pathway component GspD/PulD (secretin)
VSAGKLYTDTAVYCLLCLATLLLLMWPGDVGAQAPNQQVAPSILPSSSPILPSPSTVPPNGQAVPPGPSIPPSPSVVVPAQAPVVPAQAPPPAEAIPPAAAQAVQPAPEGQTAPAAVEPTPATPGEGARPGAIPSRRSPFPSRPIDPARAGVATASAGSGQVSFNFDDADVYSVIQTIFGDVLRVNYVVDPRIKGRVTFRSVAPVARDQVLPLMEVILRLNGIGMVEESGLYRIVPISEISREPSPIGIGRDPAKVPVTGKSVVQVVPFLYMQSTEVVKLLTPFLSANAVLIDVPKINQIIVVDTDASVRRILQLIDVFDSEKQKQQRAQVFVYHVQNGKAKDIANLLQQIFLGARPAAAPSPAPSRPSTPQTPQPPQAQPPLPTQPQVQTAAAGGQTLVSDITRIFSDETLNAIIILATPEDYSTIKETIAKLDLVPRQVVIEGIVARVSLTGNLSLGIAYAIETQFKIGSTTLEGLLTVSGASLNVDAAKPSGGGFTFVGVDSGGRVRAFVNALAEEGRSKLLAAPHILVSDNREARIQVGQQVPLVTSETYGTPGVAPIQTVQYRDIGVILKVKPQVNEGGLVSLEVNQEVSTYDTVTLGVADKTIILNKAEASTSLVVQDGQTIVIGGLIREERSQSRAGVPFLSKIPILGYLFGTTSDDASRQEIIILLTPRVIKTIDQAKDMSSGYVDRFEEATKGDVKRQDLIKERTD